MKEWQVLKQLQFDDRTVTIYRSMAALRQWKLTVKFRIGQINEAIYPSEGDAFRSYYTEAQNALAHEAQRWQG